MEFLEEIEMLVNAIPVVTRSFVYDQEEEHVCMDCMWRCICNEFSF